MHRADMSTPLKRESVDKALEGLPLWKFKRDALEKTFTFGSFREAISFMVRASYEAEELNHHPDWTNGYNRLVIRLSTHDAGGKVTAKDVELAKRIQTLSWVG